MTQLLRTAIALVAAISSAFSAAAAAEGATGTQISEFGRYEGYSQKVYDGYHLQSIYITVRDGEKMAVDIYFPTEDGVKAKGPLPTLMTQTTYGRSWIDADGKRYSWHDQEASYFTPHGYVFVAADARGTGASSDKQVTPMNIFEGRDAADIIEWVAKQKWSSGKVGMVGRSYLGGIQYLTAGEKPPALKAIFPSVASFDVITWLVPNGVPRTFFLQQVAPNLDERGGVTSAATDLYRRGSVVYPAKDSDPNGQLLEAILRERPNKETMQAAMARIFATDPLFARDGIAARLEADENVSHNLYQRAGEISDADIAVYTFNGWDDMWAADGLRWYANLKGPKKLVIGDWAHSFGADNASPRKFTSAYIERTEQLRWFDYWLKGIDNGVMDEPPIHYAVRSQYFDMDWRSAEQWPPKDTDVTSLYLGRSKGQSNANAAGQLQERPVRKNGSLERIADFSTTSGNATLWISGNIGGRPVNYPEMSLNESKSIVFTSDALDSDITVLGEPVVELYVSASVKDLDYHVYLSEVDDAGRSMRITEGVIRASHRKLGDAPYDNLGLPFPTSTTEAIKTAAPLNASDAQLLRFAMLPTGNVFDKGHRIRISIAHADDGNAANTTYDDAVKSRVHFGDATPSQILLPVLKR